MTLPEKFSGRVLRDLGEAEGKALCQALDGDPPVSVRLNPAKVAWNGAFAGVWPEAAGNRSECAVAKHAAVAGALSGVAAVNDASVSGNPPECAVAGHAAFAGALSGVAAVNDASVSGNPPECAVAGHAAFAGALSGVAAVNDPSAAVLGRLPGLSGAQGIADELPDLPFAGPVPWCDGGCYLAARPSFTLDPAFHAGAYYVQEASSQFVGHLLPAAEFRDARVLDLCAAPGGKTTLYASLAGPGGLVVANEIDRRRAGVLADNVRKWGLGNVAVTTCEPRLLGDWEGWFDIVAVDAPCSGEGMFRKDPLSRGAWSEHNVKLCAARQDAILREAWRALRPGGALLYSTCTFNRDENEGTLERMLEWAGEEAAEAAEVSVDPAWGVLCGRVGAFRTFRFYPHRARGEGFFAAVVRKAFDAGGRSRTPRARRSVIVPADRTAAAELRRWVREPERMCFAAVADTLYGWCAAQADAVRELSGSLPVICSGVAMGQLFKGRLRPDPALAFFAGLDRRALPCAELDGDQTLRFLRREQIAAAPLAEGLNLICARGRALGFAKRIGARVNNMYPNSLRILMNR